MHGNVWIHGYDGTKELVKVSNGEGFVTTGTLLGNGLLK